jgi:O-antigen ligase
MSAARAANLWPWGWLAALLVAGLIALTPPLVAALGIVGLVVAVLLVRRPVWGAYALVLSVPVQKAVSFDAGPLEITVTQVLFVFVLALWWAWMSQRQDRRLVLTPVAVALLLLYVSMLATLTVATSLPQSLAELSRWLVTILSYVVIVNSVQTRREMNVLIGAMLLAGTLEAVLGLVQAYTGTGPESFNVQGLLTRAYGTIGAPNSFAGYLNMSLPLALALTAYFWGKWISARRAAYFMDRPSYISWERLRAPLLMTSITLALFWSVVTTLSRGAWVGLVFGVLAMLLTLGRRAAAVIAVLLSLAAGLVGLGLAGALPEPITERVGQTLGQLSIFDPRGVVPTPENYALVERMVHWQTAGNMFLSDPWLGVGIGNYNVLFAQFGVQGWPRSAGHAHNFYLHMLAETGLVGTTFYVVMLITALAVGASALRRARRAGDGYGEAVVTGALGVLVTFMAHNFFEDLHVLNMGIHWGAALALFTLVHKKSENRSDF